MSDILQAGTLSGNVTSNAELKGNVSNDSKQLSGHASITGIYGCTDYRQLNNLPSINNVMLVGDKTFDELGLEEVSNMEIDDIFKSIF